MTECTPDRFEFPSQCYQDVVANFDGGDISSDGGGLLLAQVEQKRSIVEQFAQCFVDHRDPERIEHTASELIKQRVFGLALGYEDLNDHDDLRHDPLLAILVGKSDPKGKSKGKKKKKKRRRDGGKLLAGKSTLNRIELTPARADSKDRYKKVVAKTGAIEQFFVDVFLQSHAEPPKEIVLDLDATDTLIHGNQLGKFYHGYYRNYCFLPLYIFCGEHLLCAKQRPSDIDASAGSVSYLCRITERIRKSWPDVKITIRADSGFCRDNIMNWCESAGIDYILGLAQNSRLRDEIKIEQGIAEIESVFYNLPVRIFKDFTYQTRKSWSRSRRVIAKAEHLSKGANPRFIVTSLSPGNRPAKELYEEDYCARGEAENHIKEQQLHLFANRASASSMRANQLRLWFSSVAYTLHLALRNLGLQGTKLERAECGTVRNKLLKIAARIRVTARKIWVSFTSSCPYQNIFAQAHANLERLTPLFE